MATSWWLENGKGGWTSEKTCSRLCQSGFVSHFFTFPSGRTIETLASVLGNPLFTDVPTATSKGGQFARACIEVKAGDDLPDFINTRIEDEEGVEFKVRVTYDWKPTFCAKCKHFGHLEAGCPVQDSGIAGGDNSHLSNEGTSQVEVQTVNGNINAKGKAVMESNNQPAEGMEGEGSGPIIGDQEDYYVCGKCSFPLCVRESHQSTGS